MDSGPARDRVSWRTVPVIPLQERIMGYGQAWLTVTHKIILSPI